MEERMKFNTATVPEIEEHIQERIAEIIKNFNDDHYEDSATRSITITIDFSPRKRDVSQIDTLISSSVKLPKRKAKFVPAAIRNKDLLVERVMENEPLFDSNIINIGGKND